MATYRLFAGARIKQRRKHPAPMLAAPRFI